MLNNHEHEIEEVHNLRKELNMTTTSLTSIATNTSTSLNIILGVVEDLRQDMSNIEKRLKLVEDLLLSRSANRLDKL